MIASADLCGACGHTDARHNRGLMGNCSPEKRCPCLEFVDSVVLHADAHDVSGTNAELCEDDNCPYWPSRRAASGLIGSANGSALTRPPGHGGYRAGSGRKPILDGAIKRTYQLTQAHVDLINAWQRSHNLENRSAALRHMIETAKLREVLL